MTTSGGASPLAPTTLSVDTVEWEIRRPPSLSDAELKRYLNESYYDVRSVDVEVNAGNNVPRCKWRITLISHYDYHSEGCVLSFNYELLSCHNGGVRVRIGYRLPHEQNPSFSNMIDAIKKPDGPGVVGSSKLFKRTDLYDYLNRNSSVCIKFTFEHTRTQASQVSVRTAQASRMIARPRRASVALSSLGSRILANSKLSDLTVIAANGDRFPAHKLILTAQSPVFERMFSSKMKEETEMVLELKDVKAASVKSFLDYLYGMHVDLVNENSCISDIDIMSDLLLLSDKYGISEMKTATEEWLCDLVDVQCVCQIVVMADLVRAKKLKEFCMDFIIENRAEITKLDAWKHLKTNYAELYLEILEAIANL